MLLREVEYAKPSSVAEALTGGNALHSTSGRSFDDLAREVEAANVV